MSLYAKACRSAKAKGDTREALLNHEEVRINTAGLSKGFLMRHFRTMRGAGGTRLSPLAPSPLMWIAGKKMLSSP